MKRTPEESEAMDMLCLIGFALMRDGASKARSRHVEDFLEALHKTTGSCVADVEFIVWLGDALRWMEARKRIPKMAHTPIPRMPQRKGDRARAERFRRQEERLAGKQAQASG